MLKRMIGLCGALAATLALVACGGGGGSTSGGGVVPPTALSTSTPTPLATATPAIASASGRVVDFASDTPLANESVAIATWNKGTPYTQVATTAADGSFSFSTAPGTYLLRVGSDSPTDTRATAHLEVSLAAGPNAIALATPAPVPDYTPAPSQLSGAIRLATLSSDEQDCLAGMNAGRQAHGFGVVIPDEYMIETARIWTAEESTQQTDTPTPLWGGSGTGLPIPGGIGATTSLNFQPCDTWTDGYSFTAGNPPYGFATNAAAIWYGASLSRTPGQSWSTEGMQAWAGDPRP